MSIQQSKRQSDLEKRLQILRRQVYGKSPDYKIPASQQSKQATSYASDISFLQQDLFKILILSSLAIGAQIILFFLLKNHILRINFF